MSKFYYTQKTFHKGIIDPSLYARTDTNFLSEGVSNATDVSITSQGTLEKRFGIDEIISPIEFKDKFQVIDMVTQEQNFDFINNKNIVINDYLYKITMLTGNNFQTYTYFFITKYDIDLQEKGNYLFKINEKINARGLYTITKFNDTQLIMSCLLNTLDNIVETKWYIIDLPKDGQTYQITTPTLTAYQVTQPPMGIDTKVIDPNDGSVKTYNYKQLIRTNPQQFRIKNLDNQTENGYIGVGTNVEVKFWSSPEYGYVWRNHSNSIIITYARGLYIKSNGIINGYANPDISFTGTVIASANGATIKNESTFDGWGIKCDINNGDLLLFEQWRIHKYVNDVKSDILIYPNSINTYQNRLICTTEFIDRFIFLNTQLNYYTVYISSLLDSNTFFSGTNDDTDPFSFVINNKENILKIETGKKLSIFTDNGVYLVSNPLNPNLTPSSFTLNKVSEFICNSDITPVEYNNKIYYIQNSNNAIRQISMVDEQKNIFSDEISNITCQNLFKNKKIIDMKSCSNLDGKSGYLFVLYYDPNIGTDLNIAVLYSNDQQQMNGWTTWNVGKLRENTPSIDINLINIKIFYFNNNLIIARVGYSYPVDSSIIDNHYINTFTYIGKLNINKYYDSIYRNRTTLTDFYYTPYIDTTPIVVSDNSVGDLIYKPYKISDISIACSSYSITANNIVTKVIATKNDTKIFNTRDIITNTGYLNTFSIAQEQTNPSLSSKFELLGYQMAIDYQGD
jgi:hypothetical protein